MQRAILLLTTHQLSKQEFYARVAKTLRKLFRHKSANSWTTDDDEDLHRFQSILFIQKRCEEFEEQVDLKEQFFTLVAFSIKNNEEQEKKWIVSLIDSGRWDYLLRVIDQGRLVGLLRSFSSVFVVPPTGTTPKEHRNVHFHQGLGTFPLAASLHCFLLRFPTMRDTPIGDYYRDDLTSDDRLLISTLPVS